MVMVINSQSELFHTLSCLKIWRVARCLQILQGVHPDHDHHHDHGDGDDHGDDQLWSWWWHQGWMNDLWWWWKVRPVPISPISTVPNPSCVSATPSHLTFDITWFYSFPMQWFSDRDLSVLHSALRTFLGDFFGFSSKCPDLLVGNTGGWWPPWRAAGGGTRPVIVWRKNMGWTWNKGYFLLLLLLNKKTLKRLYL